MTGVGQTEATAVEADEAAARAWWELLRLRIGKGVTWEQASEGAKQATIGYISSAE